MNIYEKLLNIQTELKAPKGQRNNFGNYNYRSCEDILESVKPLLNKNKATIFISDEIINIQNRFYVKATIKFVDIESGESIETSAFAREEENKKGFDSSQVTGASSSYARKYCLAGIFAIDDGVDQDLLNTHELELSESQIKRLYAIAYSKGINKSSVDKQIKTKFNKEVKKLNKTEYEIACNGYESMIKK